MGANLERKDNIGRTPLHFACMNEHLHLVNYLLSEGANKDAQNYVGWTALHYSALKGNLDIIKSLLYMGANKNLKDKNGKKPSDIAPNDEVRYMFT